MPNSPAARTVTTAMAAILVRRSNGTIRWWISRGYLTRLDDGLLDLDQVYACERDRRHADLRLLANRRSDGPTWHRSVPPCPDIGAS